MIDIVKKFKSCVVCPERWGRPSDIEKFKIKMNYLNFKPNAVMTSLKCSQKWLGKNF